MKHVTNNGVWIGLLALLASACSGDAADGSKGKITTKAILEVVATAAAADVEAVVAKLVGASGSQEHSLARDADDWTGRFELEPGEWSVEVSAMAGDERLLHGPRKITLVAGRHVQLVLPLSPSASEDSGGGLDVDASFNHGPSVTRITADPPVVRVDEPIALTAQGLDPDGDELHWLWTSDCEGAFEDDGSRSTTFSASALPDGTRCTFVAEATDGRGGTGKGTISLLAGSAGTAGTIPRLLTFEATGRAVRSGTPVTLRARAADDDDDTLHFEWHLQGERMESRDDGADSELIYVVPDCFDSPAPDVLHGTLLVSDGRSMVEHAFEIEGEFRDCAHRPLPGFDDVLGSVHAMVERDGVVYVGGDFHGVGKLTGNLAAYDVQRGTWVSMPMVDGNVLALADDGEGGWYIGGTFDRVDGLPRAGLARIRADGTVDPNWNPGIGLGRVEVLHRTGDDVVVGGTYAGIAGTDLENLAVLDAETGEAREWLQGADRSVLALAQRGSVIYLGGTFRSLGGQSRAYVGAIDLEARSVTDFRADATSSVVALAIVDDTLYLGGEFTQLAGLPRSRLAAVDLTTGTLLNWRPMLDGSVTAIVPHANSVIVAGSFRNVGDVSRSYLASFDRSSGDLTDWAPEGFFGANDLQLLGDTLYVGGNFTKAGSRYLAAVDVQTGEAVGGDFGFDNGVSCLASRDGVLLAGGYFRHAGATPRYRLAAFELATGRLLDWAPAASGAVDTLALDGDRLFVGGDFKQIGGVDSPHLAALDLHTGEVIPADIAADDDVTTLEVAGGRLFVGGSFTTLGGQPRGRIASIDLESLGVEAWAPNSNGPVDDLAVEGDALYVGGRFSSINGTYGPYLAAVDVQTGQVLDWKPSPFLDVLTVVATEGVVYVAGSFVAVSGQRRPYLAALSASDATVLDWNPRPNRAPRAILPLEDVVYLGGPFLTLNDVSQSGLAIVDRHTGELLPRPTVPGGSVRSLLATEDHLILGGSFANVGGFPSAGIAVLPR